MTPQLWIVILNFLFGQFDQAWKYARQQHGEAIPTREQIVTENLRLQSEIDAEKGGH